MTPELGIALISMVATALMVAGGYVASEARSKARAEHDREKLLDTLEKVSAIESALVDQGRVLGDMRGETRVIHTKLEHIERRVFQESSGSWPRPPGTGS